MTRKSAIEITGSDDRLKLGDRPLSDTGIETLLLATRIAASLDGAPQRCRNRQCRSRNWCSAGQRGPNDAPCDGGLSASADTSLMAILFFLYAVGSKRKW